MSLKEFLSKVKQIISDFLSILLNENNHNLKKRNVEKFDFIQDLKNWFISVIKTVIQKYPKAKPISLKLEKGVEKDNYPLNINLILNTNFAIVNTFYDTETEEILEEYTEVVEANQLDSETIKAFGDKDMLVLS